VNEAKNVTHVNRGNPNTIVLGFSILIHSIHTPNRQKAPKLSECVINGMTADCEKREKSTNPHLFLLE
jgi:hypothetical protein